jgi:hypothetical protein
LEDGQATALFVAPGTSALAQDAETPLNSLMIWGDGVGY